MDPQPSPSPPSRSAGNLTSLSSDPGAPFKKLLSSCGPPSALKTPLLHKSSLGDADSLRPLVTAGQSLHQKDHNDWNSLHFAVCSGNKSSVKELVKMGIDPSTPDSHGITPIHLAAAKGFHDLLSPLLNPKVKPKLSVPPDPVSSLGLTPLHYAAICGKVKCAKALISHHADVSLRDNAGHTALHFACMNRDFSQETIKFFAEHVFINSRDSNMNTPLHYCCFMGSIDACTFMLSMNVLPDELNNDGLSCLHLAVVENNLQLFEILISSGKVDLLGKTGEGESVLFLAARLGRSAIITALLNHVSQIDHKLINQMNSIHDEFGLYPIHVAAKNGFIETVHVLLEYSCPINQRDECQKTALHHAVIEERNQLVSFLIEGQADARVADDQQFSPLHYACALNFHTISEIFANFYSDSNLLRIDIQDSVGNSPIHYLSAFNNEKLVLKFLSKFPFDFSLMNNDSMSVLDVIAANSNHTLLEKVLAYNPSLETSNSVYYAVTAGSDECAAVLLKRGASPNVSVNGTTPLMFALEYGFTGIISMLLAHKAHVNTKNADGKTPLYYAIHSKKSTLVTKLIGLGAQVNGPESVDSEFNSPLHVALASRVDGIVQTLLQSKADPLSRDKSGNTSVHVAVSPWL
ncbi:hypothetical protein GEMRC1_000022 [Eukaryota sp. GEM-RC1]